jgi:hypothetical protein
MTAKKQAEQVIEDMERWSAVAVKSEMIKLQPTHLAEMARRLRVYFKEVHDKESPSHSG